MPRFQEACTLHIAKEHFRLLHACMEMQPGRKPDHIMFNPLVQILF